ncbi:MAG: alkyl sulfatase dimerization domain-containing protein [Actinomycetota bacterium]|uniref:MBL fold metallo-hydrolase n=1 Tax=Mycobacterium lentiflavum TaxID=141349 RepID=A0ABY3UXY6_MYCLN|nr:alkyl sulfatase dimerization domain-containing protein [Mycobacterium lentiflavum]MEE3062488.1 alkyl sulfatase dimerization domain-containing protein [Actinomycetota bacterium]ULP43612.1 MBL fold metallo-hydrolase [Mycobacterium lentiflavum]
MAGIHRERPGAADLAAATDTPATRLGSDIWMSPGVSNSYAIATDDGRVIVNAGLVFEGPLHRKAFADVPGPTRAIVVTQGHADHWGGVHTLRDDGTSKTQVIMHRNYRYWRDDNTLLMGYRTPKTSFAFQKFSDAVLEHFKTIDPTTIDFSFPEPTTTFDRRHGFRLGGRAFELTWTPGGETTDALVVWLAEDRILFTGNLFGPLFGHVPNLMTIRGDRYRDPILYIESLNTVLEYGPRRLITGHFDPIDGADRITEEVTAMRDGMQAVHDRTAELMNAGADIHTAMREVAVPGHLDIGEGYGKTAWNVRAIWEMYTGWFRHRSTTELYGVAPDSIAADVVNAAGTDALVEAARTHVDNGRPLQAIHLTDLILSAQPAHPAARAVAADAHEALLAGTENFWEKAWLTKSINELRTDS